MWKDLGKGLAWFGIGLGIAEAFAPGTLARLTGLPPRKRLIRAFGAREIAAGATILLRKRATAGLVARVAGDALDLGALGAAFMVNKKGRARLSFATAAVVGVTALDILAAKASLRKAA